MVTGAPTGTNWPVNVNPPECESIWKDVTASPF